MRCPFSPFSRWLSPSTNGRLPLSLVPGLAKAAWERMLNSSVMPMPVRYDGSIVTAVRLPLLTAGHDVIP